MRKLILFGLTVTILSVLYYLYGTAISLLLVVTIIAMIAFFIVQIQSEKTIEQQHEHAVENDIDKNVLQELKNKLSRRSAFLSALLLLIIFVTAIFTLKKVIQPTNNNPWFFNTSHYAIGQKSIAFTNTMPLTINSTDSNLVKAQVTGTANGLQFNGNAFDVPVFLKSNDEYILANKVTPNNIGKKLTLTNSDYDLSLNITTISHTTFPKFWDKKKSLDIDVAIQVKNQQLANNVGAIVNKMYQYNIKRSAVTKAIAFNTLLIKNVAIKTQEAVAMDLVGQMLNSLDRSYLVNSEDQLYFFAANKVTADGYRISIDDKAQTLNYNFVLPYNKQFHVDLGNSNDIYIAKTKAGKYVIERQLPQYYYLNAPEKEKLGQTQTRFLCSELNTLTSQSLEAGFYFANENIETNYGLNATVKYKTAHTNQPLSATVTDNITGKTIKLDTTTTFNLQTANAGISYQMELRNLADNKFTYSKSVTYLCLLFLALLALIIIKPNTKMYRLEPIIASVILVLYTVRLILFWRLATFPPVELISYHEFENTLRSFDFNILGIQFGIPVSLFFIIAIIALLFVYRINKVKQWVDAKLNQKHFLQKIRNSRLRYAAIHGAILVACAFIFTIIKVEILMRLSSLLVPMISYFYFTRKIQAEALEIIDAKAYGNGFKRFVVEFVLRFIKNPAFLISLSTLAFLAITDRGFAVVFLLFLLLKNIVLNFAKFGLQKGNSLFKQVIFDPRKYWIYALISLVIYLLMLSFKSLAYYLLVYKLWFILAVLFFAAVVVYTLYGFKNKWFKAIATVALIYSAFCVIPSTHVKIDQYLTNKVKHVQYRASIIHQSVTELISANSFNDFNTQKIVETAQNQWFINSYVSKSFDAAAPIQLQPFTKVGVNYNTQTRDVIVARLIIGEMGNLVMYLLLAIFLMPLLLYALSYQLRIFNTNQLQSGSYAGLVALMFLFTLALFVWLTSTNRFVFFGQDFPFLSLTSRFSVLFPMVLLAIALAQKPVPISTLNANWSIGFTRYAILVTMILAFGFSTFSSNELNKNKFSINITETKNKIEQPFNAVLEMVQDSLQQKNIKYDYSKLMNIVFEHDAYKAFKQTQLTDAYTKSIFARMEQYPAMAYAMNSPIYMRYDQGQYFAEYNANLYLALAPENQQQVWHGNIVSGGDATSNAANYLFNGVNTNVLLPVIRKETNKNTNLAMLPGAWFNDGIPRAIVHVSNAMVNKPTINVQSSGSETLQMRGTSFASTLMPNDALQITLANKTDRFLFQATNAPFVTHKWVNNKYRAIYPIQANNIWNYNFTNALHFAVHDNLKKNIAITIDYSLTQDVQKLIDQAITPDQKKNRNFSFGVIAADGNGNISIMNDYVTNRKIVNTNNEKAIRRLQNQHYFFSNAKNERDQWANLNFLNLQFGPGSSIKPLLAATTASQINAGWENLQYVPAPKADKEKYAGLKLGIPWKDDEHYFESNIDMPTYIQHSSNYYHSLIMFLGAYSRNQFVDTNGIDLANLLERPTSNNDFPKLMVNGQALRLPSGRGNSKAKPWPKTAEALKNPSYFGNENSVMATGLNINANLTTRDNDKLDGSPLNTRKVSIVDTALDKQIEASSTNYKLWSYPEPSSFTQSMRYYATQTKRNEINHNFNHGLKFATLGGYPYQLTPFKMLEMYSALFTYNNQYQLHITAANKANVPWKIDSSWNDDNSFKTFLAKNVFEGMRRVINAAGGTATKLKPVADKYKQYFFYAKTGTIGDDGISAKNSKRLIVCVTNKDMTQEANIGNSKVYSFYFTANNSGNFDWQLLKDILSKTVESNSFKLYFNN